MTTSDANIGDTTSIYKVSDGADGSAGAAGQSAPVAFLSNENVTFAANASGQVAATSVTCNVVAYSGATKVTPTVNGNLKKDKKGEEKMYRKGIREEVYQTGY